MGGGERRGEHTLRVGIDPVVLDERAGVVLGSQGVHHPAHKALIPGGSSKARPFDADLVHTRPQHDGGMRAIPANLGSDRVGAVSSDRADVVEFVVGDGLGDRDVAVQQHPQPVARSEVARVERAKVKPQHVEPELLRAADLAFDIFVGTLGVEVLVVESLYERAAHHNRPVVDDHPSVGHLDRPQPHVYLRGVCLCDSGTGVVYVMWNVACPRSGSRHAGTARRDGDGSAATVQHRLLGVPSVEAGVTERHCDIAALAGPKLDADRARHAAEINPHRDLAIRRTRSGRGQPVDLDGNDGVVGIEVASQIADGDLSMASQRHRLPDPAVGEVEAGRAGELVIGPALLAVGDGAVRCRSGLVVGDVDDELVPAADQARGVDLERGVGQVVASDLDAVEFDTRLVHDSAKSNGPVSAGVAYGEVRAVAGGAVEVDTPLRLPQAGNGDRRLMPESVSQRPAAVEEGRVVVNAGRSGGPAP